MSTKDADSPPSPQGPIARVKSKKSALASSLSSIASRNKTKVRGTSTHAVNSSNSSNNNNAKTLVGLPPNNPDTLIFEAASNAVHHHHLKHQPGTNWGSTSRNLSRSYEDIPHEPAPPMAMVVHSSNSFDDYIDLQKHDKDEKKRPKIKDEEKRKKREEKDKKERDEAMHEGEWEGEPELELKNDAKKDKEKKRETARSADGITVKNNFEIENGQETKKEANRRKKTERDAEAQSTKEDVFIGQKDRKESKKKKERDKDKDKDKDREKGEEDEERSSSDKERDKRHEVIKVPPGERQKRDKREDKMVMAAQDKAALGNSDDDSRSTASSLNYSPKKKRNSNKEKNTPVKSSSRDKNSSQKEDGLALSLVTPSQPVQRLALLVSRDSNDSTDQDDGSRKVPVEREDSGEFYRHLSEGVPRILDHVLTPQRTRRHNEAPSEDKEKIETPAVLAQTAATSADDNTFTISDPDLPRTTGSGSSIRLPPVRVLFESADGINRDQSGDDVDCTVPNASQEPEDEPWAVFLGMAGPYADDDDMEEELEPANARAPSPIISPKRRPSYGRSDQDDQPLSIYSVSPPAPSSPRPDRPTPQPPLFIESLASNPPTVDQGTLEVAGIPLPSSASAYISSNMAALPNHLHVDPSTDYRKAIARVAAQLHPDLTLSKMSLIVMNKVVNLVFDHIASEAAKFARDNRRNTITSREIQMAIRLIFSEEGGNMAQHCIKFASQAVHSHFSLQERIKREQAEKLAEMATTPPEVVPFDDTQGNPQPTSTSDDAVESDIVVIENELSHQGTSTFIQGREAQQSTNESEIIAEQDTPELDNEVFLLRSSVIRERKAALALDGDQAAYDAQRHIKRSSGTERFYQMMSQGAEKNRKTAGGDSSSDSEGDTKEMKRTNKKAGRRKKQRNDSASNSTEPEREKEDKKTKEKGHTDSSSSENERKKRKKRNKSSTTSSDDSDSERRVQHKRKSSKTMGQSDSGSSASESARRRRKKDRDKRNKKDQRKTKSSSSSSSDSEREKRRERREKKRKEKEKLGELSSSDSEKEKRRQLRREKRRKEREKLRDTSSSDSERERKRILREKRRKELQKLGELSTSTSSEDSRERRRRRREKKKKELQKLGELSSSSSSSDRDRKKREKRRERKKKEQRSSSSSNSTSSSSSENTRDKPSIKRKSKEKRRKEHRNRSSTSSSDTSDSERRTKYKKRHTSDSSSDSENGNRPTRKRSKENKKDRKKKEKGASSSSSSQSESDERKKERRRKRKEKERERDAERKKDQEKHSAARDSTSPPTKISNLLTPGSTAIKPRKRKGSLSEVQ